MTTKVIKFVNLSLCLLCLTFLSKGSYAQQITGTDILNLLLDNGVLSKEQIDEIVDQVRTRQNTPEETPISNDEIIELLFVNGLISEESKQAFEQRIEKRGIAKGQQQADDKAESEDESTIRVPYIPKYVQDEMEQKLKFAVESDIVEAVHEDVVRTARTEGWGIKEAPSWVYNVKVSGDGRVRYQGDYFPSDNGLYSRADIGDINDNGTSNPRAIYKNVKDDRHRLRSRFRLMFKAKPFETVSLGLRLTTGDSGNPVSSNQTLGNFSQKWESSFDLGYIHYRAMEKDLELWGGRFNSPMLRTDLIFDNDMTFEGVAANYYFLRNDTIYEDDHQWDPYISAGIYPIQEIHQFVIKENPDGTPGIDANPNFDNADDKFLYALQLGTGFSFYNRNELDMALSFYHYENITGKKNQVLNGDLQDVTLSPFYQNGNTLFDISNDPGGQSEKLALASDFSLVNATLKYTLANFFPTYVFLHADYVKNIGFDRGDIAGRIGTSVGNIPQRDTGYQFGIKFGTRQVKYLRDWQLGFTYRHLEGDAVVDAFADSDFYLGGTDAEGFMLSARYGLLDNVVASARYLTAESIDIDQSDQVFNLSVDTLFLDLSARF